MAPVGVSVWVTVNGTALDASVWFASAKAAVSVTGAAFPTSGTSTGTETTASWPAGTLTSASGCGVAHPSGTATDR